MIRQPRYPEDKFFLTLEAVILPALAA